jgi:lipopolysaccharide export system permease protein
MDRYLMREMIVPFIAGSFIIALLFAANQLIFILKTFTLQNVPIAAVTQMLIFKMPFWLNMTLPAGISLAASLAITRMARESEITAMRACGVRVIRILMPVAAFGLIVAVGNYFLVEKVMPKTEAKANKLQTDVGITNATPSFQSNVWISLQGKFWATFREVRRINEDTLEIKDVMLGQRPTNDTVVIMIAPAGSYSRGIWTFNHVSVWEVTPTTQKITPMKGDKMTIPQPIFVNDIFSAQMPEQKTSAELAAAIKAGKASGRDMTHEEILLHERFSVPAACIIFALVAPIFAIAFARSGSFVGLLLSMFLVLLYYNAFVISTEIFGNKHWVSPWMAAWLPNFVFLGLGLLGVRRLE